MQINLADFSPQSAVNGPGKRAVIWVQGCPFRCPGCYNQEFIPFRPASMVAVDDLADRILDSPGIEGITLSGGEPFCQATALGELVRILRKHSLNVVTFSGFSYERLRSSHRSSWKSLLKGTDLLVAGPYRRGDAIIHPLIASVNQSLIYLSDRLQGRVMDKSYREVELVIDGSGDLSCTGFPDDLLLSRLKDRLEKRGDECRISAG